MWLRRYDGMTHTDPIMEAPMRGGDDPLMTDLVSIVHVRAGAERHLFAMHRIAEPQHQIFATSTPSMSAAAASASLTAAAAVSLTSVSHTSSSSALAPSPSLSSPQAASSDIPIPDYHSPHAMRYRALRAHLEPDSLSLLATIPAHSTWHSWLGSFLVAPIACLCRLVRPVRAWRQRQHEQQQMQSKRTRREQTLATLRETESLIHGVSSEVGGPAVGSEVSAMAQVALVQGEKLCPHWLINVARKINPF